MSNTSITRPAKDFTPIEVSTYYRNRFPDLKQTGDQWRGGCPVHGGSGDNFVVEAKTGRACCHSKCGGKGWNIPQLEAELYHNGDTREAFKEICEIIGRKIDQPKPKRSNSGKFNIVAEYPYTDKDGKLLFQVVRLDPKDFRQRQPDPNCRGGWNWKVKGMRLVPYRLPKVLAADTIYLAEGEKDVHAIESLGLTGSCNPMGAEKWRDEFSPYFTNKDVIIIADKDEPGRRHVAQVAASLNGIAKSIRIIEVPVGKDIADWVAAGATREALEEIARTASPLFMPQASQAQEPKKDSNGDVSRKILGEIIQDATLFVTTQGVPLIRMVVDGRQECWELNGRFARWVRMMAAVTHDFHVSENTAKEFVSLIASKAEYEGNIEPVFTRFGHKDGKLYLDLVTKSREVVEISSEGWKVIKDCPINFLRFGAMNPLPYPVAGGSLDELRPFLNAREDHDWILMTSWLVSSFMPTGIGAKPLLMMKGIKGSWKTTTATILKKVLDPTSSKGRMLPSGVRELAIACMRSGIPSFDNLSGMTAELSDALCQIASGIDQSWRKHYEDGDEYIISAHRAVILNGIDDIATRPDLLDRGINLSLEVIADSRLTEEEVYQGFDQAHPRILGALLDVISAGLKHAGPVKLQRDVRMIDFAKWAIACEYGMPWERGRFIRIYTQQRNQDSLDSVESDLFACAIRSLAQGYTDGKSWEGPASELFTLLEQYKPLDHEERRKHWPTSPRTVRNWVRRVQPILAAVDVQVNPDARFGDDRARGISIGLVPKQGKLPIPIHILKDSREVPAGSDDLGSELKAA